MVGSQNLLLLLSREAYFGTYEQVLWFGRLQAVLGVSGTFLGSSMTHAAYL